MKLRQRQRQFQKIESEHDFVALFQLLRSRKLEVSDEYRLVLSGSSEVELRQSG